MSRTFDIVLGTVGLVAALGLIGAGFFFMVRKSYDPAKIIFKLSLSILLVIGAYFYIHSTSKHLGGGVSLGNFGTAFMMAGCIVTCGIILSILWTPHLGDLLISPLTSLFDGGNEPPDDVPFYSIALSRRKRNQPLEAIVEIRKQLAKFPNDYEGVSLLASIQAEDTRDLPAAEITLNHFCDRPDAPPNQVAAAWTQMADWQLKLAHDVDSARAALEKIIARFPQTALAAQAAQRIAHLVGTQKILLASEDRQAMPVPEGVHNIGLLDSTEFLRPAETDPKKIAAGLVQHLAQYPLDTEARERLAVIYARDYERLDLAALELQQLIDTADQPVKRVARWINLLADLQIHGGAGYEAVKQTLEKILTRFPGLPVADLAQSRLGRLKLEIKGQEKTPTKQMGVYEQNVGLKYGSPRRRG